MESDHGSDYSDYEFQQIHSTLQIGGSTADGNVGLAVADEFEVLGAQGGLSNDEVAELVYAEVQYTLDVDDETGDQNVGTFLEGRGVFGSDLDVENFFQFDGTATTQTGDDIRVLDNSGDNAVSDGVDLFSNDQSSPEVFQRFASIAGVPFDDQTNGPGGTGGGYVFHESKNWRELTGRGPVLDATDNLSVLQKVIIGDTVSPIAGNVSCHLVWDVAEMDDAGQRFAVPSDD